MSTATPTTAPTSPATPTTAAPAPSAPATGATPTGTTAPGAAPAVAGPTGIPGSWSMVLDSEFGGRTLDTSIWRAGWFGDGITGPVNTAETACYSPGNVTLPGDGTLHLSVTAAPSTCAGTTEPYTGALISSDPDDGRPSGGF